MDAAFSAVREDNRWSDLAQRVLEGHVLTRDEGLSILHAPDAELLDLLAATFRVRLRHFGRKVHLYYLKNAKSGLCPEDCGYCSQFVVPDAPLQPPALLQPGK